MDHTHTETWIKTNTKPLRHPNNKEFVTGRVNIINKKFVIRISIGLIVCELLNFGKKDRLHLHIHKDNRHLFLLTKSELPYDGYKLNHTGGGSFLSFAFRYPTSEAYKLSQTIILDFKMKKDALLVNLDALKMNGCANG